MSDLTNLAADLTAAASKVRPLASQAVRKSGLDMVAKAQAVIVQEDRIDSGDMMNSVGVDFSGSNASVARADAGPTVDYAPPQEWGFTHHITGRFIPGIHFMSRAADAVEPGFVEAMSQLGIDAIVGR